MSDVIPAIPAEQSLSQDNFESSLETLESIVNQLENGDLSLDQSLSAFEKGIQLTRDCQKTLADAEQKIKILTDNGMEALEHD